MRVDAFDFDLPEERIALHAVEPRDAARLLVAAPEGALRDRAVRDLADELRSGDLLVFNDTRVLPVQLESLREREGTPPLAISATLVRRDEPDRWSAFVKPGRRVKTGDVLRFGDKDALFAEVLGKEDGGLVALRFDRSGSALDAAIAAIGAPPLPPYIAQRRAFEENDRSRYQTVYAARDGSVAAPTAGLHFTPELLQRLEAKGIARATVTLHVGLGTFLPVKVEDTDDHVMHAEWGEVSAQTVAAIETTRAAGGRVIAVGTTSLRLLETAARSGRLQPFAGETAIFITPGFAFHVADGLMTNFHLPKSTLMMLVAAFAGMERMQAVYAHAIASGYRFFSYGDASLLWRAEP